MKTAIVQKVVIKNADGMVLLLQRSKTDVKRPGTWDLPGGHADEGEALALAITREIKEETGLEVANPLLVYATTTYHEWQDNKENVIRLFYVANTQNSSVVLSHEHMDYKWSSISEAIASITYDIQKDAMLYLRQKSII